MSRFVAAVTAIAASAACSTVGSQAPLELKAAENSVDAAKKADVEDYMPSAMEAAKRKLAKSVDLLDDSSSYQKDGVGDQASSTRASAIKEANEAKAIADGAVRIVADMRTYDTNSGEYLSVADKAARTAALETELANVKAQNADLDAKLAALTAQNKALASRPAEETIPNDFRVGKPVAYFSSGSTVLAAKYRPEIAQLGSLLQQNKELEVKLEGFADPRGSAAKNRALAEKRLQVVAEELKASGIDSARVKLVTVGATADAKDARGARAGELQLDRKVTATLSKIAH